MKKSNAAVYRSSNGYYLLMRQIMCPTIVIADAVFRRTPGWDGTKE